MTLMFWGFGVGGTYPGKGDAGGVHGGGGGHGSFVAQQHHEAGQAVEEGGEGRGWLLDKEEPREGPLRGDGGGQRDGGDTEPQSPPHPLSSPCHGTAARGGHPAHRAALCATCTHTCSHRGTSSLGMGSRGSQGGGSECPLLPAPPPVPLRTVSVRTPICHGQGEGSRMALSVPSGAQCPPIWPCAPQHSPACCAMAQCSPRTDQQPSSPTQHGPVPPRPPQCSQYGPPSPLAPRPSAPQYRTSTAQ